LTDYAHSYAKIVLRENKIKINVNITCALHINLSEHFKKTVDMLFT